ncbi:MULTISPECIES: hypothetical protein [unclassified Moorena]|uniref:hypothetical protein n=1 Tax=unclassified Moorena TaxID=2683338 RepID=UPI0013BA59C0|nr:MULTISPECIES: hypothetical protein [unclassified Moorena]NEP32769.1 hypothetical protein [Moorena sp. SIO3B2]NEQ12221.1 hypothetical protein [Moorena sp. SIO4E2]NER91107.1 hypothetical protein [Moorena sp. SIO3A2]NES45537.1 hypothetical protein [Moorena sp. SIO2C4]
MRYKYLGFREQGAAMQRGLGGFPHERLHQDGSREEGRGKREKNPVELTLPISPPFPHLLSFWQL